jgi:ubiquinone/menaquinone biosynthesis C-methylase UbiE
MAQESGTDPNELRILDVASGPEMLLRHSNEDIQGSIFSVDKNPHQLSESDSGRAIVGNFTNLPLKSGSFDYVNLALGLHYTRLAPSKDVYERLEVITEINRVLKVGGRAVLSLMYSLDLKDDEQFMDIASAFGFKVVEELSGDIRSDNSYCTKVITLEKVHEVKDGIADITDILLEGNLDGIKFAKNDRSLRDSRRMVDAFELQGVSRNVRFNQEDARALEEEKSILEVAEQMKELAGGDIMAIPREALLAEGFTRFFNGKRYVLFKKMSNASGSVVVR